MYRSFCKYHTLANCSVLKMKFIVAVTATLLVVAQCKPQYNYPAPSGSYGTPGTSGISGGVGFISGGTGGNLISGGSGGGFGSSGSGGGFGSGGSGGGFGSGGSGGGFGSGGSGGGFGSGGSGAGFTGGSGGGFSGGSGGGFSGGSGGGFTGTNAGFVSGGGGGGVLVQKHIYVHVAPPEPEEFSSQKQISAGQATKHYKIIFIKAPSYSAQSAQSIALQQQNQEKTLVYVLVKKPEDAADFSVPTISPTQPSKPEVYFIRYKAKSEAVGGGAIGGSAINGGAIGGGAISGGSIGGGSIGGGSIGGGSIGGGSIGGGSIGGGNIGINTGSSSVITGRPAAQYGPPGQSGPY